MPMPVTKAAAASQRCLVSPLDGARRRLSRSHRTAHPSMRLLTLVAAALVVIGGAPFCSCQSFTAADLARVNQACSNCDLQFISEINAFQNNFIGSIGVNASNMSPLEVGNIHCGRFSLIASCYVDCLGGLPVSYSTATKGSFQSFYEQFCDPQCQLAFIPGCYIADGVGYTLYRTGCDEENLKIRSGISSCMDLWLGKQNCAGVCTSGARAASGLKLHLETICKLPGWVYECSTVITSCIEQTYGPYGSTFIAGGSALSGLGSTSCRNFDGAYAKCLSDSINTTVVFGRAPYDVSFIQPCQSYQSAISYLQQLSKNISRPLCDNPQRDFVSICPPPATSTSAPPTSTSTTSTPTTASSTLATSTVITSTKMTTTPPATSTLTASTAPPATSTASLHASVSTTSTPTTVAYTLAPSTDIISTKMTSPPVTSTLAASTFAPSTAAPSSTVTTTAATRDTGLTTGQNNSTTVSRTTGATVQIPIATSTAVASAAGSTALLLTTTTEQTIRSTVATSVNSVANQTSVRTATAALNPSSSTSFAGLVTSTKPTIATATSPAGLVMNSTAIAPEALARISRACAICDSNYTTYLNDFQNSFYRGFDEKTADPLNVADFHCSRMSSAMQCYNDCVLGYNVVYVSTQQAELSKFYKHYCDADCRMAFLPHCYLSQRLEYSLYRSGCDEQQRQLKSGVLSCIDYWSGVQRCSGMCTAGQRALSSMKLMLESICRIPILADDCGINVDFCIGETFGPYGSYFVLSNDILVTPASVTCGRFISTFTECLGKTVNGQTTIGSGPAQYRSNYVQPCGQYSDAIDYLIELANGAFGPLCEDPSVNVSSYCEQAMVDATTRARTTTTAARVTFTTASRTTTRKTAQPTTFRSTMAPETAASNGDDESSTDGANTSPNGGITKRMPTTSANGNTLDPQPVIDSSGERHRSSHFVLWLSVIAAAAAAMAGTRARLS